MIIGVLQVRLHIPAAQSLKEKRLVLKGLIERIRVRFNISCAELEDHYLWQSAVIGMAAIGNEKKPVNQVLDKIADLIRMEDRAQLIESQLEFF